MIKMKQLFFYGLISWFSILTAGAPGQEQPNARPASRGFPDTLEDHRAPIDEGLDLIVILEDRGIAQKLREARQNKQLQPESFRVMHRAWVREQDRVRGDLMQQWKKENRAIRVLREYRYLLNGLSVKAKANQIKAILADPRVKAVYPDRQVRACLTESVPFIGAHEIWNGNGPEGVAARGEGMVVAIIDTGIDYTHPDLGGGLGPEHKVMGGYDFIEDDEDPMDDHGHGTHVAGIVAANGEVAGVAPEARLLAYKVLDFTGRGTQSDIIAGIERAADPDGDPFTDDAPHVINLSLGGFGDANDPQSQAVNEAVAAGIVVVVSAGNNGNQPDALGSPGAAERALTVGFTNNEGLLNPASSHGPALPFGLKPEIVAPGFEIISTVPDNGYFPASGSSMAAAHVSGAAALILQLHPDWDPERLANRLIHGAIPMGSEIFGHGAGLINLVSALSAPIEFQQRAINLGRVDLNQESWRSTQRFSIANPTDETRTYTFEIEASLPMGVSLDLDTDSMSLAPGQTAVITITAEVDNKTAPFPANTSLTFHGVIHAIHEQVRYPLPFGFRKSVALSLDFQQEGSFFYQIFSSDEHRAQSRFFTGTPIAIHLRPDQYVFMGVGLFADDEGKSQLYYYGKDVIVNTDLTEFLGFELAKNEVTHLVKDLEQRQFVASEQYDTFWYQNLTHLPSGNGIRLNFLGLYKNLRFFDMSDDFLFETLSIIPLNNRKFGEIGYWLRGISKSQVFENDLSSFKELTFVYETQDDPASDLFDSYRARTRRGPGAILFLNSPDNQLFSKTPFEVTDLALPQGPIGPEEDYRLAYREFRFASIAFDPDFEIEHEVNTLPFRVFDHSDWTLVRDNHGDFEEVVTTDINRLPVGLSPLYPVFRVEFRSGFLGWTFTPHLCSDPWQSGIDPGPFLFTLELPDGTRHEARSKFDFYDLFPIELETLGPVAMNMTYENRLNGQAATAIYTASFDVTQNDSKVPLLKSLEIMQNGKRTDTLTGPAELIMEWDEPDIEEIIVEINPGYDWQTLTPEAQEPKWSAAIPELPPGRLVDLRIIARDKAGNEMKLTIESAFRTGFARVIPWVVNNGQWSSRVALYNPTDSAVEATLETTGAEPGHTRTRAVTVPAQGVFAAEANELFGDFSGYSLKVSSVETELFPSFLTFNKEAQSGGNAPSQSTGSLIESTTSRLLFPYLPGDQIPAVVLCAPERGTGNRPYSQETPVLFQLIGETGILAEKEIILADGRPYPFLVYDLFEEVALPADAVLIVQSKNGSKLAGTTFTFNQQREPSMEAALSHFHNLSKKQIIPWIVNNDQWDSRIAIFNLDYRASTVRLRAVTIDGQREETCLFLEPMTLSAHDAGALFPGLSGYSLIIEPKPFELEEYPGYEFNFGDLYASFLTFNKETQSGGNAPSQATAVQAQEPASTLAFAYLPTDQTPAMVLVAPEAAAETLVTLKAFGSDQGLIAVREVILQEDRPFAALVKDLFPGVVFPRDVAVEASTDGVKLAGVAFIFNDQREPSMTKPIPRTIPRE